VIVVVVDEPEGVFVLLVVTTVVAPVPLPVPEVLPDVWLEAGAVGVPEFCWEISHHPPRIIIRTIMIPMTHAAVLLLLFMIGYCKANTNSRVIVSLYA
jgi:hypothetical protein